MIPNDIAALPQGWEFASLGDVIELKYGKGLTKLSRNGGCYTVYGSNGVVGTHSNFLIENSCLVVGRKGSIGEVHVSKQPCWAIDTTYYADEFYEQPIKFWFHRLKALPLGQLNRASAIPGLNREDAYRLPIALPPLNEQHRIVAKIEALMARSQQVKEALEAIPPLLDQFRQSVLAAAFRGDLTADCRRQDNGEFLDYDFPSTWKKEKLGNLLDELRQGWSPKCEIFPSPCNDIWGVIKTTAVQSLRFIEGENKQLPSHLEPRPELEILEGDLLITRAGPRARAGVTCLVSSVRPKLIACDKVYRFRVKESYVLPPYLAYFLNSASTISLIDELKTGISDSGVNLTQEKFLAIPVWFPPIAEQQKIVNKVKTLFKIADEIEQQYQQAKPYLDQLDQSILAKAFRGELVPQDPSDEPASVLLERIQAERAKQEAAAKAAKKSAGKTTGQRSRKAKQQDLESIQLGLPGLE